MHDGEPVLLNRNLILQALKNVVHNAIKYSYQGGVVGIALFLEESGMGRSICVEVRDSGKGVREEDGDRVPHCKKASIIWSN